MGFHPHPNLPPSRGKEFWESLPLCRQVMGMNRHIFIPARESHPCEGKTVIPTR